jgi:hypothetical protein
MAEESSSSRRLDTLRRHLEAEGYHSSARPEGLSTLETAKNSFEFTKENDLLTVEQRMFYEKNGFLVIPKLVSQDRLDGFRARFLELCNDKSERVPTMTTMRDVALKNVPLEGENNITKVQDFQDDDGLFNYCKSPEYYLVFIVGMLFDIFLVLQDLTVCQGLYWP